MEGGVPLSERYQNLMSLLSGFTTGCASDRDHGLALAWCECDGQVLSVWVVP